ncbi:Ig-like domain-containing protein, partial [Comamonas sp. NoAH]|uniref:Ig-like domain-containing protein n=1 Tax=Comamonas halotolerans TaxID=3041496 RepID=UPI0024E122B6
TALESGKDHSLTSTLTDEAGNTSAPSDALVIHVDTSQLSLTIEQVLDNEGNAPTAVSDGGRTNDKTPTFEGQATAGATVTIYEGSTAIGSTTADASGHWSVTLPEQSEGVHSYTAQALNAAGNTVSAQFALEVDTTPSSVPSIESVKDDVGTVQTDVAHGGITDDTTPTLVGKGTAGDTIRIYDNASLVGTTKVQANGEWSYTVNPALTVDGEHKFTVTSVDSVGNESAASAE